MRLGRPAMLPVLKRNVYPHSGRSFDMEQIKAQELKTKKEYSAPRLSTHGDVAKLTEMFDWHPVQPGSNIVLK
jgi:hypothetical protein